MERIENGVISIKVDVDQVIRFFDGLGQSEKTISRAVMRQVGQGGVKAIKGWYSSILNKRSGKLYKSIKYKVSKNGRIVILSADANSGKNTSKDGRIARYGYMLASGYEITAKKKYLTFNINGKWIKKKSVRVAPRDFVEGVINRYMHSGDLKARIDKAAQKQLDKITKKMGVSV